MIEKLESLKTISKKIEIVKKYLLDVQEGKRRNDPQINLALNKIINKLSMTLNSNTKQQLDKVMNDNYLSLYVSSLSSSVLNVHQLIDNRIKNFEENIDKKEPEATQSIN